MDTKQYELNSSKGFTLIEIMIVLAVVAILIAIATPQFSRIIARGNIKDCTETLISNITLARKVAQTQGQRAIIVVTDSIPRDFNVNGTIEDYLIFLDVDRDTKFTPGEPIVIEGLCKNDVKIENSANDLDNCPNFGGGRCMSFTSIGSLISLGSIRFIQMGLSSVPDIKTRISIMSLTGRLGSEFSGDGGITWIES